MSTSSDVFLLRSLNIDDAMIKAAPETPVDPPGGNITEQSREYNGIIKLHDVWAYYLLLV